MTKLIFTLNVYASRVIKLLVKRTEI